MLPLQSKRNIQTGIMHLNASPRHVFPLLCPQREYDWIEPWQCRMIFSETGVAEDNAVFYTDFRQDRGPEWWVVSRYEPVRAIAFVRFSPGNRITRLDIHLAADGPMHTIATWTQTMTALSPEGNAYIDHYGDSSYTQEINTLEHLLNYYLQTGRPLKLSEPAPEGIPQRD
jgi:hypothetical protein